MYRMLKKHEIILDDVLKQLIQIIIRLGIVTGNALDINTDIVIAFDDSIIEDKRRRAAAGPSGCQHGSDAA